MKHDLTDLPVRLQAGDICIQSHDWSDLNVARIRFPKGADATPLLQGLPQDLCQCPHWGAVVKGSIHVRYADGSEEVVKAGEVYYWPPGHTVRVEEDYEAIEFSPSGPMRDVEGENMRSVTWVRIQEFESGDWAIGGKALSAADVQALAAGKAA